MSFYRRRLPHWQPEGAAIFLTWRLHGSLPRSSAIAGSFVPATEGERFLLYDREMDRADTGPTWLRDPAVAACVVASIRHAEESWKLCRAHAWVVMPNHVHLLVNPHRPLAALTRAIKNTSAREANLILGRTGLPFWQDESYDHWVRNREEFNRIVRYIESNPVRAGLVNRIEDWLWSSASGQVGDLPHDLPQE